MIKRLSIVVMALFFAIPLFAQKRAFSLDDYYAVKSVGSPQLSPDGKTIAFTVTEYDLRDSTKDGQIWLMASDGSNLRQLTSNDETVSHPRWSPSGKSILYVAKDSITDKKQSYSINVDSREVTQLTSFAMGVSSPSWTPNGKSLVFTSRVFPEAGANSEQNKTIQEDMDAGPVKAHMTDDLLYRHWTFWKDGKRKHTLVKNLDSGDLTDLTPGQWESPRFDLRGANGYDISPNGKELCYVSNHDKEPQSSTNGDLWIVQIGGGKAQNITSDNPAYDGNPQYSPNGRYIAYRMQKKPGYESDLYRLAIYDTKTQKRTILTEDFKNWVSAFQWAPDSKSIYFTAPYHGHYPIYNIDLKSQKIAKLIDGVYTRGFEVSPNGKMLYFASTAVDQPTEIFSAKSNGKNQTQLTMINKDLMQSVDFRPVESGWVKSTDGSKIQVFIVKPHNFDPSKKYPLILNVHGGPQGMFGDSFRGDYQIYPGSGYVVAFSNPHGSVGYGQPFTAEISGDWGGQVFNDLMAVVDSLETLPYIDKDRMGAMGWSYGGYMMDWFEGHTTRFKALASMMGVYDLTSMYGATEELWFPEWDLKGKPWTSDLYQKWSPSSYVKNFQTPCLVITGMKDFRVPYTQSLQFFTALQEMNVPSRLIIFEKDGHWPDFLDSMPLYYNAHLDWFHKYLGGDPAPYNLKDMWRNQILNWGKQSNGK